MAGFFTSGLDAVAFHDDQGFWFFKDDECVKTNGGGTEILGGGRQKITTAFPILKNTIFASHLDAVVFHNGGFWFFKGDQCVKTNGGGTSTDPNQESIIEPSAFPALDEV
ncbi:hypothetical protein [Streptomyces sp. McG3]|uniref:hypothetical protein n=1 Tax=Streptomyces sp. McG3 TaxID=2725483 RepID=UPI001BED09D3|nr:hypothetical protein [Streptomyces sp. McG3]MBT2896847.1 hypothetical protein [Streptomyces sp. McG3]